MKLQLPKINVFEAVAAFSDGCKKAKDTADAIGAVGKFVLLYNSKADEDFQKANPLPPASAPDLQQIVAYTGRSFALTFEMVQAVGKFCAERKGA